MTPMAIRQLRLAAGVGALLVAGIHLYWAMPILVRQLHYGLIHDPRPIAFVLASMAIIIGAILVLQGVDPKPFYLGGAVLMVVFLIGYGAWHTVLDHGGFWPGRNPHGHDAPGYVVIIDHLLGDRIALASKILELIVAVLLLVLYRLDRPDG